MFFPFLELTWTGQSQHRTAQMIVPRHQILTTAPDTATTSFHGTFVKPVHQSQNILTPSLTLISIWTRTTKKTFNYQHYHLKKPELLLCQVRNIWQVKPWCLKVSLKMKVPVLRSCETVIYLFKIVNIFYNS